ncbi:MAG: DNA-binding response regulator [Flavobacterium psychrophilum]|nr:MAG: DNA-binding response regulator [Flavobacterium psychrophilum]
MPAILIADDHAVTRRGIKEIILSSFPTASVETANDAEELMQSVIKKKWDIIITDLAMPGRSGLDVLQIMTQKYPKIPVLVLSIYPEEEYAVRVIKAGAAGYLNKYYTAEDELVKAVSSVLSGRKYITDSIAIRLADEISETLSKNPHELLSNKEYEVFKLLAQGRSTGEIAKKLSLSVNTIATFRSRILSKMNIRNNAGLVAYGVKNNLI